MLRNRAANWLIGKWFDFRAARHLSSHPGDYLAVLSIKAGREFGARTARHNAELVSGQPVTDVEWFQFCGSWDRTWAHLVG